MAKAAPETARISPDARERYEPVIGLEVHAQLRTQSKIFCGCSTRFGDPPNTNVCEVCLGLPGTLPVLNRRALEMAIRAALALHCTVQERSRFARKNYFYPDLPKGYQISMYELPLAEHGWLDIEFDGGKKHIGLRACTWKRTRPRPCTRASRTPPKKLTLITTAAGRRSSKSSPSRTCGRQPRPTLI